MYINQHETQANQQLALNFTPENQKYNVSIELVFTMLKCKNFHASIFLEVLLDDATNGVKYSNWKQSASYNDSL